MSIRQPKPKAIRLPFAVPRPQRGAEPPARICGICRQQDSRYTCPRCNVAYCSLACFRAPAHAQCSEPFYKATVREQIAADAGAGDAEKRATLAMLRRFEEAAADGEDVLGALQAEEGDDDDALAAALDGVDLDTIDSNELFRLLPPAHRDAFLAAMRDPESEETRELLADASAAGLGEAAADADAPPVLPWWEGAVDGPPAAPAPERTDPAILAAISPPAGVGPKLAYNVLAVVLAYLHTLLSFRLPSLDSAYLAAAGVDPEDVKAEIAALVPFLTSAKSTTRYTSAQEAWGAVWEGIGGAPGTLPRLLDMAAGLLHPPITTDPPRAASALDDLYALFARPKPGAAAPRKIAFYLAALGQVSRPEWLALEREVRRDADKLREESAPEPAEPAVGASLKIDEPAPGPLPPASITLL
ncbi:hypothetical protein Q8F55_002111 [Vanrija albida]|uniref:HIT-type domain-containing protein n=1 Tax=Vanrija albida TaxID=181172 RepID=A0ABR3Q8V7_9TREE